MEKEFNKIIFFGAGNIAQAIMLGLLEAKTSSTKLLAINKNPMHDVFLRKHAIKKIFPKDLGKLNHPNNILLLAVKPKDINIAVDQLRFSGYEGTVCSLAAGVSLRKISQLLGSDSVVSVRCSWSSISWKDSANSSVLGTSSSMCSFLSSPSL